MDPSPASLGYALAALALVVGLIWLTGRLARRLGLARSVPRPGGRLTIAETLQIDPKRQLLILRCDACELLILSGGGTDVLLGWLPAEAPKP